MNMKEALLVLVVVPVLAAVCEASVIELTDGDFDSTLKGHDTALVMFYAPWCGHCKQLKPEFEKAGKILVNNDPPVQLTKVDCTADGSGTCSRFDVKGYPTLKIFRNGEVLMDYNGPRESSGIVKYMKAQAGPSSKELADDAELKNFLKKDEVVVLGLLKDSSERDVFMKVADKMRETCTFGHASKSLGGKTGIVLVRPEKFASKFEDKEVKYSGKMEAGAIQEWIKENYHGLVGHKTPGNAFDFQKLPLVNCYYEVDYIKNTKGTNYWRNRIMKVAKGFPSFTFVIANRDDLQREVDEFGFKPVGGKDKPQVAIKSEQGKFPMSDEFSVENFEKFLKDFEAGKLKPYVKSEELPADNSGNVKVAVGKNFDELVMKNDKDVLVEFYAPWCGHCKQLAPIYDELGDAMADENVEIVKIDATANDFPPMFNVRGFPTIYFVPSNSKKPITYDKDRSLDAFISFIAENSSKELKTYDKSGKKKKEEL